MNKEKLEKIIRFLGAEPVDRAMIMGHEVFIGDGFSESPHASFVRQGALSPGEFPKGCFVTWWFAMKGEDKLDRGAPVFFDPEHDAAKWVDDSTLRQARINIAKEAASRYLKKEYGDHAARVHVEDIVSR